MIVYGIITVLEQKHWNGKSNTWKAVTRAIQTRIVTSVLLELVVFMAHVSILTIVCVALELKMKTGPEYYATSQFASKLHIFLNMRIEIFFTCLSLLTNICIYLV